MNLSEKTTIPLWAVFAMIPTFVGGIVWVTFIAHTTTASAQRIEKLEQVQDQRYELLLDIRERLVRIEERLKKK